MEWLSVKTVAALEGVTPRTIRNRIANGQYDIRPTNGVGGKSGEQHEISLDSLQPEYQARYHGQQLENQDQAEQALLELTEEQREDTFAKLSMVRQYKEFKRTYPNADKMVAFLQQYNDAHPDNPINKRKLNHWERLYDREGLPGLIDRRGTWNKGVSSIPEDVKQVFLAYWLQQKGTANGGPSVASCLKLTQMSFPDQLLPSVSTFERFARNYFTPAKIRAREGKKAYQDKCEPYIERNYENIHTNQQWTADNHQCDTLVQFPDGHVGRPWVVSFEDFGSRYMTGFHVIEGDPNSDHILDAFISAVGEYGIPEKLQTDNGKDYTVYDLFDKDNAYSLANEMCLSVTKAIKFNAKAKPVERGFGTIEYGWLIHLSSYVGANPKKRPDHLNTTNDKLVGKVMTLEEFRISVQWAIDQYNNTPHSGNGMNGRTPKQAFEEKITVPIRIPSQELLSIYFQRRTKLLTVGRNGIRIGALNQHYDDIQLFPYIGKKVFARYKTTDVRFVYCFTPEGKFICTASSVQLGELSQELSAQQMRELNAKKRARSKMVREHMPQVSVPSIPELAIQSGMSFNKPDIKLLPSVLEIDPEKETELALIRKEEQRLDEERRDVEPALPNGRSKEAIDAALYNRVKSEGGYDRASNAG